MARLLIVCRDGKEARKLLEFLNLIRNNRLESWDAEQGRFHKKIVMVNYEVKE